MRSPRPKVLHKVGGRTLLDRAIDVAEALGCARVIVVAGRHAPEVADHVRGRLGEAGLAIQDSPLGTGDAVKAAEDHLSDFDGDVLVLSADAPLLQAGCIQPLFDALDDGAAGAVLGFEAKDPGPYGRLIADPSGALDRIVEAKDASPAELEVRLCNSAVMAFDRTLLFDLLSTIDNRNAKGEYYLTDVVAKARQRGLGVALRTADEALVMGVNSQAELAVAEAAFQRRRRSELLDAGVWLHAPETTHLSFDTIIEPGAVIEPFVVFGPGALVRGGAVIRAFSHVEGAEVAAGALIGPYARLRPGARIGANAHIGNFVEVKNVEVGEGAKANHLAYLGDGSVGSGANIGAGVIFCNYDGFDKHRTDVGAGAFVGSNAALVAPVRIGDRAYVGSGSTITADVSPGALALARGSQVEKPGWVRQFFARKGRPF